MARWRALARRIARMRKKRPTRAAAPMIHQMNLMISPMMNSTPIRPANPPPPLPDLYLRRLIAAPDPTKTADTSPLSPYVRPRFSVSVRQRSDKYPFRRSSVQRRQRRLALRVGRSCKSFWHAARLVRRVDGISGDELRRHRPRTSRPAPRRRGIASDARRAAGRRWPSASCCARCGRGSAAPKGGAASGARVTTP